MSRLVLVARSCTIGLFVLSLFAGPAVRPTRAASLGLSVCHSVLNPSVVYAVGGIVYRTSIEGSGRCVLAGGLDVREPRLSPDGRRLAFLSGGSTSSGAGSANTVRVVRVGQPMARSRQIGVPRGHHVFLTWSPDSRMLAFVGQSGIWLWRADCGCVRLVAPGAGSTLASLAWSPDSRSLMVYLPPQTEPGGLVLPLTLVDAATGARRPVTVRFPAWITGGTPRMGWYPSEVIAWLPGNQLLLATSGRGVGLSVTGVFLAPASGGMARTVVGTPRGPRLVLKYPLLNASRALVSPNRTKLLLDPVNRLWVGPSIGGAGHSIDLGVRGSCAVSQIAWVGNKHVAYVTVCTVPGTADILARLYSIPITGRQATLLASVRSAQQDILSLTWATRCIACGGA